MKLSEIQKEAVKHIRGSFSKNKINPICALDMGLGKTRVACEIISDTINENQDYRIMIIHKASNYLDPWHNELETLRNASIYLHGKERNKHLRSSNNKYDLKKGVIIQTTYDTAAIDIREDRYDKSLIFDLLIFDEIHTIVNHKRLPHKIKDLVSLAAKHKLALTGTPIQNDNSELGLIYLFLNKPNLFCFFSNDKQNRERQKLIKEIALNICLKNKAVFRIESSNSAIAKSIKILSVPIDHDMLKIVRGELKNYTQKKMMYLSHPNAIYFKNGKNKTNPYCAKEEAVKIILHRMLIDEKAIIFSLYIDVLYAYDEICKKMEIPVIIITGKEKGKALEEKLTLFRHSSHFRILLTTLQKSSEGLNLDIANHIIILEFWWNPQKIFQAMSRVDRINQKRGIFIYLLCYNNDGEMIDEEEKYFETMNRKFENAKTLYQENQNDDIVINDKYGDELDLLCKKMPDKIIFKERKTFPTELNKFLSHYSHKELSSPQVAEAEGISWHQTKDKIAEIMNKHRQYCDTLSSYPWRMIVLKEIENHFLKYYQVMLSNDIKLKIDARLKKQGNIWNRKLDSFYPIVFVDYIHLSVNTGGKKQWHLFIVGINKDGMKELLGIWNPLPHGVGKAFYELKQKGLSSILIVVVNDKSAIEEIKNIYPDTQVSLAFYYFISIDCKRIGFRALDETIEKIEEIFLASSKEEARNICDKYRKQGLIHLLLAKKNIQDIELYFHFSFKTRVLISSTSIIKHLELVIRTLIDTRDPFYNIGELLGFFYAVSDQVLSEKWFEPLPDWDNVMKELKAFSGGRTPS
jgi:SNF2 family DNA or RNA helicase